jgi:adenylate kinase
MLDKLLEGCDQSVDAAVKISVDKDVLLDRLSGRGRDDDDALIVAQRLHQYDSITEPMAAYYRTHGKLCEIDGLGTKDEVFDRIMNSIEAAKSASN